MRRFTGSPLLLAAIIVSGCLATGCGSGSGPISSFSPTRSVTAALPSRSATASTTAGPTVTPSATAPAPAVQPSSSAAAAGASSAVIWPWFLLAGIALIVLIGLIVLISRASGRRSRAGADWRSRVIDAYAKGSALHDAMMVAAAPGALAAADADARWSDIQRRADDLTQTLYALREAAPDADSGTLVADVLVSLQVVRSAMDAQRATVGGGSAQQAEVVRSRLSSFEASLRALRASGERTN